MKHNAHVGRWLTVLFTLLWPLIVFSAPVGGTTETLRLQGADVPLIVFPARGHSLLLWLPSESGIVAAEHKAAAVLAKAGVEVWLPDLHAAYFLPMVPSSLGQIPVGDVARVIGLAQRRGKAVYLVSGGRGTALALQAATQLGKSKTPLRGAMLLSPNLYTGTPEPGADAKYLPIATRTRLPIFILQPEHSPWRWRVDELESRLRQGGSQVKVKLLPGVRDRFYYREDVTPSERALAGRLPELILNALKSLKEKQ